MKTKKIIFINGFTLIELLIVMAVIGVMATVVTVSSFQGSKKAARDARRKADVESIRSGVEMYKADFGFYPNDLDDVEDEGYMTIPADPGGDNGENEYDYSGGTVCAVLEYGDDEDEEYCKP